MSFFGIGKSNGQGYGNIYTPHAGSMIIQVQREHGLANRTLVLTPRQMRALRFVTSRRGLTLMLIVAVSWIWFAARTAQQTIAAANAQSPAEERARLDSLEHALGELQKRYDHVSNMLGGGSAPVAVPAVPAATPAATPPVPKPTVDPASPDAP